MSVFIWSDLHLYHRNIIKYCNRPFEDEEKMNKVLLDSWKKIKSTDTIINLGDVFWGASKARVEPIIKNLPGFKILILGNHDRSKSPRWWREVGFDEVSAYPIIYKGFFMLSHEDMFVNENMPYINVHGHVHQNSKVNPQNFNVSVEVIGYTPLDFQTIIDKFRPEVEKEEEKQLSPERSQELLQEVDREPGVVNL